MTTTLAITNEQKYWTDQQLSALKQLGLSNASGGDLAVFFHQAQKTGLDPFARQIYMIERGGKFGIQTSIDGLRIIAQRSGEYAGQAGPVWCGEDGEWTDVWLLDTPPLAAKVGVYRQGFSEPLWAVAKYDSYCPLTRDGKPMGLWTKMPEVMLAKCAESLALRKAFPNDMSGLYTDDEMAQVDVIEEKVKPKKVDLQALPDLRKNVEPTAIEPPDLSELTTLEQVRLYWNEHTSVLDDIYSNGRSLRSMLVEIVTTLKLDKNEKTKSNS